MLDAPRLLLERAREPLYVLRFPLPIALRLEPALDMSRLPMRSALPLADGRLAVPRPWAEGRLPLLEAPRLVVVPAADRLPVRLPL